MPNPSSECVVGACVKEGEAADNIAWALREIAALRSAGLEADAADGPEVCGVQVAAVEALKADMIVALSDFVTLVAGSDLLAPAADAIARAGALNESFAAWMARVQRLVSEVNRRFGFF